MDEWSSLEDDYYLFILSLTIRQFKQFDSDSNDSGLRTESESYWRIFCSVVFWCMLNLPKEEWRTNVELFSDWDWATSYVTGLIYCSCVLRNLLKDKWSKHLGWCVLSWVEIKFSKVAALLIIFMDLKFDEQLLMKWLWTKVFTVLRWAKHCIFRYYLANQSMNYICSHSWLSSFFSLSPLVLVAFLVFSLSPSLVTCCASALRQLYLSGDGQLSAHS